MHYSVRILSPGATKEEARANAFAYAAKLVEEQHYDYFDPDGSRTHRLASKLGQEAVEGALRATREDFDRALAVVKLMLRDFTDEQIYQEDFGDDPENPRDYFASRWQFGQVNSDMPYLYGTSDFWGGPITNDKDYKTALSDQNPGELWVTSLDFHN